jgi:hypothetical protein
MAEYIKREAAVKSVLRMRKPENSVAQNRMLSIIQMDMLKLPAADVAPVVHGRWIDIVDAAPTVDAEVVVRCKDCVHYDMGVCLKIYSDGNVHPEAWQPRRPEDYCSHGERKEE